MSSFSEIEFPHPKRQRTLLGIVQKKARQNGQDDTIPSTREVVPKPLKVTFSDNLPPSSSSITNECASPEEPAPTEAVEAGLDTELDEEWPSRPTCIWDYERWSIAKKKPWTPLLHGSRGVHEKTYMVTGQERKAW